MKVAKGKVKKPLHQPIPELVKAETLPEAKRRKGRNLHFKREMSYGWDR